MTDKELIATVERVFGKNAQALREHFREEYSNSAATSWWNCTLEDLRTALLATTPRQAGLVSKSLPAFVESWFVKGNCHVPVGQRMLALREAEAVVSEPLNRAPRSPKVMGENLEKYLAEARWTKGKFAAVAADGDEKAVREHISGRRNMRPSTQQIYERVLSKELNREVSLTNYTPPA